MKSLSNLLVISAAFAAIAAFAWVKQDGSCCVGTTASQHDVHHEDKAVPAKQHKDKQTITVLIDNGYKPAAIEVVKGKPLEITFTGGKNLGCGGTIVFKSLKITKDVATGKSIVIKFTPTEVGAIPFTCGMGMLKGKVIVK